MMQRSFGAGALIGGALLALVLLGGCASSNSAGGGAIDAVNLGVPTRPAASRTSVVIEGEGKPKPLSKATLQDLSTLADDTGESLLEVTSRALGRDQFRSLMKSVSANDSDILVTWGYENDAQYGAWVLFSEDPPDETIAQLRTAPLDVLVETGITADEKELERVRDSLTESLGGTDGLSVAATDIDVRHSTISVSLVVADSSVDVDAAKLRALERATKVSVGDELPGPVLFDEIAEMPDETLPANLPAISSEGTLLVVGDYVRGEPAMEALVSGEIGVSAAGCITVGGATVVAPAGSGFLPDGRLDLAYLGEYTIGDSIDPSSGGYVGYGDDDGLPIPAGYEQCGAGEYAVLNP